LTTATQCWECFQVRLVFWYLPYWFCDSLYWYDCHTSYWYILYYAKYSLKVYKDNSSDAASAANILRWRKRGETASKEKFYLW